MDKTDRIYQPKTGTHSEHVFAALVGLSVDTARHLTGDRRTDSAIMLEPITRYSELMEMAKSICLFARLEPDDQPDELLEGAWENDDGVACLEQDSGVGFTFIMYALYGATSWQDHRDWTKIRLPMEKFERHWLDVTGDEDA